jgi:hypothetical protein
MAAGDWKDMFGVLDHGADPNLESVLEGQTPLQAARQQQMTSVVNRLLALGARP